MNLLVNVLAYSIDEFDANNVEDLWNTPWEPQHEGGPVDEVNLEPGGSQQYGVAVGSNDDEASAFDFNVDYPFSPPPELSRISPARQVFAVEPDTELDEEEDGEEEQGRGDNTYIWFQPDIESEGDGDDDDDDNDDDDDDNDDDEDEVRIEESTLVRGEYARQLDVKRDIDDLGTY